MEEGRRRVYYPGFWYTRGVFAKTDSLTKNAIRVRIAQVMDELRLLALIYDEIYVPRSHFLTSFNYAHRDFISGVINSKEFQWLIDNGLLVSSISPTTDSKGDTDRIFERTKKIKWLYPALSKREMRIISQIEPIKVDSNSEANNSLKGYRKIAKTIEQVRNVSGLSDMITNSSYKNIEFFHERFLKLLQESLIPQNVKEEFWRATNEIYLTNIGEELGKIIVPYDEVEPRIPRNIYGDMRLYNANTLRVVMNIIIGLKKYIAWVNQDIHKALGFRLDINSWEWCEWKEFQSAYFKLLLVFDEVLNNLRRTQNVDLPDVNSAIISEMSRIVDTWGGDIISAFTQVAGGIAQIEDPLMGVATRTSTAGLNGILNKFIRYCILNVRYKPIATFMRCVIIERGKK